MASVPAAVREVGNRRSMASRAVMLIRVLVNFQLPTTKFQGTPNYQFPKRTSKKETKALEFTWELAVRRALVFGTWVLEIVATYPLLHMITHHA